MRFNDSIKGFQRGIHKVIPPKQTYQSVLKKLKKHNPPILGSFRVLYQNHIPQAVVSGAAHFLQVTGKAGANGKGHFRDQALASGLMELVERYSCYRRLKRHDLIASFDALRHNRFTLEDFYSNFIPQDKKRVRILTDAYFRKALVRWYKGFDLNGTQVFLPANLSMFVLQGSNGMAAGNTREEALLQGVCEVLERHCNTLVESRTLVTPTVIQDSIASAPARKLIKKYRDQGQKIIIKDLSLRLPIPVVCVIRRVQRGAYMLTAGAASSPEEALIRALVENSQIQTRQNYKSAGSVAHHFKTSTEIPFSALPDISDTSIRRELEKIHTALSAQGMRMYFVDATDKTLRIPSVIVSITRAKFSEAYLYDRNRRFAFQRDIMMGLLQEAYQLKRWSLCDRYLALNRRFGCRDATLFYGALSSLERGRKKAALADAASLLQKTRILEFRVQARGLIKKILADP